MSPSTSLRHRRGPTHAPRRAMPAGGALTLLVLLAGGTVWAPTARAQGPVGPGVQLSAVGSAPFGGDAGDVGLGGGWEAQVRFQPAVWSAGIGVEQSWHGMTSSDDRVRLLGIFVEPRWELDAGIDFAWPYLAVRAGYSRTRYERGSESGSDHGFVLNGGGGLLVRLGERYALDVGATAGIRKLGAPRFVDLGVAFDTIARLGFMVGLGG